MRRDFARNRRAAAGREFRTPRTTMALLAMAAAILVAAFAPPRADAAFGVADFVAEVRDQDGTEFDTGRRSPVRRRDNFTVNTTSGLPTATSRTSASTSPPGLISNPEATPKCTDAQYARLPARRASSAPRS